MSRRQNNAKKVARLRKTLRRQPLPAYIDLVTWLKDRGYAQTTGQAKAMLLAGRVRVAANAVGRRANPHARRHKAPARSGRYAAARWNPDVVDGYELAPFLDSRFRTEIYVA